METRRRGLAEDRELEAIRTVISALEPLDDQERSRILEYVLKRLQMATVRAPTTSRETSPSTAAPSLAQPVADIRSLKEEKQPRSANEMAALVAYYVSELAPEGQRSDTVNAEALRRYFKMAAFRLPQNLQYTLPNAAAAGYVDNISRGEYRLNPVGYNLVVHALPREGGAPKTTTRKRTPRKKQPAKKKSTPKAVRKKKSGR